MDTFVTKTFKANTKKTLTGSPMTSSFFLPARISERNELEIPSISARARAGKRFCPGRLGLRVARKSVR